MHFDSCECIEDVKKAYYKLVKKFHPDNNLANDTTKIMQEVNAEYEIIFNRLKSVHRNMDGELYTKKEANETASEFAEVINAIVHFLDCKIEIIGNWVWVSGETKKYKDTLKSLGFRWINNKSAWSYHRTPYRKRDGKTYSLDELRKKFGSDEVKMNPRAMLT